MGLAVFASGIILWITARLTRGGKTGGKSGAC